MPEPKGKTGGRKREKPSATQKAVDLLSRSVHSRRELKRKLLKRAYDPEQAEAGIRQLEQLNFLNENRDAAAAARSLYSRGYWGIAVRAHLQQRGFSRQAVDEAVTALEADETAEKLLKRLMPSRMPTDERSAHRLAMKLIRRGLPVRLVRSRVKALTAEAIEELEREAEPPVSDSGDDE